MWPMVWLPWRRETKRTLAETQKVRCVECGFLAVRHQYTRGLDEVDADARKTWTWASTIYEGYKGARIYGGLPICFRMAHPLGEEANSRGGQPDVCVKTIEAPRECEDFDEWQQGFTPKEHQEVINAKELRALEATARKSSNTRVVVLAGIFTLLGAFIGVAGAVVTTLLLK